MRLRPTEGKILVRLLPRAGGTLPSGLFLMPERHDHRPYRAAVVEAVGPDERRIKRRTERRVTPGVCPGSIVLIDKRAGLTVVVDGQSTTQQFADVDDERRIICFDDVMAVVSGLNEGQTLSDDGYAVTIDKRPVPDAY